MSDEQPPPYRIIDGRVAYIAGVAAESLATHLRRVADEVERVEAKECDRVEGISHLTVQWDEQDDWTTLLVIE